MKKLLLLGVTALAAAAFAVPASASAYQWTELNESEQAVPLTEDATIALSGTFGYVLPHMSSSFECPAEAEATLSPGGGGEITRFALDQEACQGTGLLQGCQLQSYETNAPWEISLAEASFSFGGFQMYDGWDESCWFPSSEKTGGVTATANNATSIGAFTLSGDGTDSSMGPMEFYGELEVTPAGTYGIAG